MDFHEQSRRGAKTMQAAMKKGETCIECHMSIAHKLPKGYEEEKATKKTTTDGPWPGFHMFVTRKRKSGRLGRHIGILLKESG